MEWALNVVLNILPFSLKEMEAAVSTAAEYNSLPVCLLGSLWSHFIYQHGGTMEKYVYCMALNYLHVVLSLRDCCSFYNSFFID